MTSVALAATITDMQLRRHLTRFVVASAIVAGSLSTAVSVSAQEATDYPPLPPGCMWTWDYYMIVVYGAAGWCADDDLNTIWFDWWGNYWYM